mgnify:FL=1
MQPELRAENAPATQGDEPINLFGDIIAKNDFDEYYAIHDGTKWQVTRQGKNAPILISVQPHRSLYGPDEEYVPAFIVHGDGYIALIADEPESVHPMRLPCEVQDKLRKRFKRRWAKACELASRPDQELPEVIDDDNQGSDFDPREPNFDPEEAHQKSKLTEDFLEQDASPFTSGLGGFDPEGQTLEQFQAEEMLKGFRADFTDENPDAAPEEPAAAPEEPAAAPEEPAADEVVASGEVRPTTGGKQPHIPRPTTGQKSLAGLPKDDGKTKWSVLIPLVKEFRTLINARTIDSEEVLMGTAEDQFEMIEDLDFIIDACTTARKRSAKVIKNTCINFIKKARHE